MVAVVLNKVIEVLPNIISPITVGPPAVRNVGNFAESGKWIDFTSFANSGAGTVFDFPARTEISDNQYAVASFVFVPGTSQELQATGLSKQLPPDAVITSIEVSLERKITGVTSPYADTVADNNIQLLIAGVLTGNNKAVGGNWPIADTYLGYPGAPIAYWGLAGFTAADANHANFGFSVSATKTGSTDIAGPGIDHMRVRFTF